MKRTVGLICALVLLLGLSGLALAWMGGPGMGMDPGRGMMGAGRMGERPMGSGPGAGPCWGEQGGAPAPTVAIDEGKAKQLATDYAGKNLPGYKVDRLVKFDRPRGAMYQIELKGPKGELQYLHINPFGVVRAFGAGHLL